MELSEELNENNDSPLERRRGRRGDNYNEINNILKTT